MKGPLVLPSGGSMVLVALCTPIAMLLLLLGMDAFEELLSKWPTESDDEPPGSLTDRLPAGPPPRP
ncbi:hypothetical protein CF54_14575, partial [Streptomyces sp. Tu 6176]